MGVGLWQERKRDGRRGCRDCCPPGRSLNIAGEEDSDPVMQWLWWLLAWIHPVTCQQCSLERGRVGREWKRYGQAVTSASKNLTGIQPCSIKATPWSFIHLWMQGAVWSDRPIRPVYVWFQRTHRCIMLLAGMIGLHNTSVSYVNNFDLDPQLFLTTVNIV